jgi:Leu/Phe-tRNA-protein transferase
LTALLINIATPLLADVPILFVVKKNRIVTYQIQILSHKKMSVKNIINLCSLYGNGLQNREKRGRAIEWDQIEKKNIINLQYLHNITNMQHLISFLHISIPVNSMRTFPCM